MFLLACGNTEVENNTSVTSDTVSEKEIVSKNVNSDYLYTESNVNSSDKLNLDYTVNIPNGFKKVDKGNKIFIYDSVGSSLIISKEPKDNNFTNYTKNDYHKIIGSSYGAVTINSYSLGKVDNKDAIIIKFESQNNNKEYINMCYYVNCGEFSVKIFAQAIDETKFAEIIKSVETIKIG